MAPRFTWYPNPLEDWDFQARIRAGKLLMTKPNTPDRHIAMLADNENPAVTLADQSIPLDEDRTKLSDEEEICVAGEWSAHFLDKLYRHPQHYRPPETNIPGCHVIGLFNGDLIIDAISTKRPGEMHYTFNRTTKMLQKVTGISLRGGWKAPPIHLGDTPGNEMFRLGDREVGDEEMEDVVVQVDTSGAVAAGKKRVEFTFNENDEAVAMARIAEDGTVEKEVDRTMYRAHNVLELIAAKKGQDIDDSNATIDLQIRSLGEHADDSDATIDLVENNTDVDDSDATIDLIQDHTPSEADTVEDPDLTDGEDWSSTYPQRHLGSELPSKAALEERARVEYHGKLNKVAEREKRHQLQAVEKAATMAAEAVMSFLAANTSNTINNTTKDSEEASAPTGQTWDAEIYSGENMDIDDSNTTIGLIQDMDSLEVTAPPTRSPLSQNKHIHSPIHPQTHSIQATPATESKTVSLETAIDFIQDTNGLEVTTSPTQPPLSQNEHTHSQIHPQTHSIPNTTPTTSSSSPFLETTIQREINTIAQRKTQYTPHQLEQIRHIEEAAAIAAQAALLVVNENPRRSGQGFIEEAATIAAKTALEMHEKFRGEEEKARVARGRAEGVVGVEVEEGDLESVDGGVEDGRVIGDSEDEG